MAKTTPSQLLKLLDEVRHVLRLQHYSIHTERSYMEWIVRFIQFHNIRTWDALFPAESHIEAFLTHLAVQGQVAVSTQNQAMHALVFLYKRVLKQELSERIDEVRAPKKPNASVVMMREEGAAVL